MAGVPVTEPSHSPIILTISSKGGIQGGEDVDQSGPVPFASIVFTHASRRTTILCSPVSATFTSTS